MSLYFFLHVYMFSNAYKYERIRPKSVAWKIETNSNECTQQTATKLQHKIHCHTVSVTVSERTYTKRNDGRVYINLFFPVSHSIMQLYGVPYTTEWSEYVFTREFSNGVNDLAMKRNNCCCHFDSHLSRFISRMNERNFNIVNSKHQVWLYEVCWNNYNYTVLEIHTSHTLFI